MSELISVYRSGNILARRINWNACSWRRRRRYSIRCAKVSRPTRQRGVHARYQWELSGPQGGQWWIDVNGGKYKMGKERSPIQMSLLCGQGQGLGRRFKRAT